MHFDPRPSTGKDTCPITTLYWDFLLRHEQALKGNPRMVMQLRNLSRLDEKPRAASASRLRILLAARVVSRIHVVAQRWEKRTGAKGAKNPE